MTSALSGRPETISSPYGGSNRATIDRQVLRSIRQPADVKSGPLSEGRLVLPTVQIASVELVTRLGTGCPGWFVETVHAPIGSRLELQFQGFIHLLVMYNEGARREGEAAIDGFAPSKIRTVTRKLTFV